ncbi:3-oxoacyl-ACP synthase III family protein [Kitasatospora sp. NPDC058965]|uniref:3-oxoacyl-ACP synthase III family protein n=1 Tax=Kitasatospora sp. NPDC058965 TaxID=3346682 RepID=UPI0036BD0B88
MPVGILATGAYVPPRTIDNATISAWAGTTETWVTERTGIEGRRYAEPGTTTSDLAAEAVRDLFEQYPDARQQTGLLVLATSTPDQPQPATAAKLQHRTGLSGVPSLDVNAVCSGFLYALAVADSLLARGTAGPAALVVGADMYSTIMDRTDRRTVALFGDGAGAVLLAPVPEGYGIHATRLVTDSDYHELVEVTAGGTREPLDSRARAAGRHLFRMNGPAVLSYALQSVPKMIHEALDAAGWELDDVDRVVLHQGNTRMLQGLARHLGVDMKKVPLTAPKWGNTGAASIPITLQDAHRERPFERGERVLLAAVGGGMTAGASVLTWY